MSEPLKRFYEFGSFRVDAEERQLLRDGEPQALTRKAFDTLLVLVRNSGRVLEKDEFMKQVWPDTFVEEANLANNISLLRKVLGESSRNPFIQTVPGRGYRFVASVQASDDAEADLILEKHTLSSLVIEEVEQEHEGGKAIAEEKAQALARPPASASLMARPLARVKSGRVLWLSFVGAALLVGLTIGWLLGKWFWKTLPPSFQQLTYHRGLVWSARFSPDGQNIIYSASWEGQPSEIFSMRSDSPESRSLGLTDMNVLSISSAGEMAVLLHPHPQYGVTNRGTLARVPLSGGAPREIMENVQEADWSPDGKEMAVVRYESGVCRLEYPIGTVLYEMAQPGWMSHARVSPKGDMVAFLEHPVLRFDDRGSVAVVDLKGRKRTLSKNYNTLFGLAWSPQGDEVWFTAGNSLDNALRAINLSGQERTVLTGAGRQILQDIAPSGRLLLTREIVNLGIIGLPPGETKERDLSWLNGSYPVDLSDDGKMLLIDEEILGGEGGSSIYLRRTDNSPAVRLGDGTPIALSPDGKWVLARQRFATPPQLVLLPTGAGEAKVLPSTGIEYFEAGGWFPDSKRLLLTGKEPGHEVRCYELNIESGERRPVTPEGVTGDLISPDGKSIIASSDRQPRKLFPLDGAESRMIPGLEATDQLIRWSADGRSLYVAQGGLPVRVYKLDLTTGRRELWKEINSSDPAGLISIRFSRLSSDERSYTYNYLRILNDLFIVEGAR
jgi:DNA-binding winged helix-turn-helix (wHTH) protein/Tol biopolymer transport system component